MRKKIYLTKQGLQEMQNELDFLIRSRRPELAQLFKNALATSTGSSESEECNYIRSEQALVEKKIIELKDLIKSAKLVENVKTDKVSIGTMAKLRFLTDNKVRTYSIVGTHEANPFENKLSDESPIVRAILGRKLYDTVTVDHNFGEFKVRILGIFAAR